MYNEYNDWENQEQEKPVSPFANSPYEQPKMPYEPKKTKQKREKTKRFSWVAVILVVVLVAGSCFATAAYVNAGWNTKFQSFENKMTLQQQQLEAALDTIENIGNLSDGTDAGSPGLVYAQNVQAVVAISNQSISTNFYGQISETASSGSGFIISEDGYVVSNYHVVADATKLSVITADSKEYEAELVGYDASNDLAVLKIDATGLPYAVLGSSDDLAVGERVAAIGNPLGELTSTLTVGYVSAKDRMVNTDGSYLNMLQTDAAINSGNSGGPLFNMQGEVVGITTAKASGTSNSGATIEGIGFAIPIDDVVGMINDLIEKGYISGAYMGVSVMDVDPEEADFYGFPAGAYIKSVEAGSAAEKAGIQAKDIVVNIGGETVGSMSELTRILRNYEPGQTTTITVYRSGAELELSITFDDKPKTTVSQEAVPEPTQQQEQSGNNSNGNWFDGMFPGFGGLFPGFGG